MDIGQQILEKYNIDINEVYKGSGKLMPINKEWYPIVFNLLLNELNIDKEHYHKNGSTNEYTIFFNNKKEAVEFDNEFLPRFMKSLNKYIISINKNPKDFNRSGIIETKLNETTVSVCF